MQPDTVWFLAQLLSLACAMQKEASGLAYWKRNFPAFPANAGWLEPACFN